MEEYTSPMDKLGYINQDFQTIYPQLLDLAKELTDKWDPSQSNESDPGVVLIKEDAILADKLHYSIDKTGLETFPATVTQLANARELFDQGGYTMQWYIGATGEIYLRWIDSKAEHEQYTVPMFSMLADENSDIVYTTTQEVVLPKSGETSSVPVIQGTVHDYDVNGNTDITMQNLDEENRLYFKDYNIAENGIFVSNSDSENWDEWKSVDNLYTYEYGSKIFKFGVLQDNSTCYIEFPEYAGDIIGSGINIKYILTAGEDGNIKANTLSQFYDGAIAHPDKNTTEEVVLTSDNVAIIQSSSILTGYDPESIQSAYRNFKKTVTTFNTLVSLIDYNNYLNLEGVEQEKLSNGFTTDRTNDIQDSYYIVTVDNDVQMKNLVVEEDVEEESPTPLIQPFQLKLYLLKYSGNFESLVTISTLLSEYEKSFTFLNSVQQTNREPYNQEDYSTYLTIAGSSEQVLVEDSLLEDVKCVSNYFKTPEANKILFLKNKYPLNITIVPNQTLTKEQKDSMEFNVIKALCIGLNSKNVSFGQEINYDEVFDMIKQSDGRIRTLFLDDLTYITHAVYFDPTENDDYPHGRLKEIEISNEYDYVPLKTTGTTTEKDATKDPAYTNYVPKLGDMGIVLTATSTSDTPPVAPQDIYGTQVSVGDILICVPNGSSVGWGVYSKKRNDFRTEIFSKSVLAGKTQFLIPASDFKTSLSQKMQIPSGATDGVRNNISSMDTHFDLFMRLSATNNSYTLKSNEGIYLTAPNIITEKPIYGCRYVCQLDSPISSGTNHRLGVIGGDSTKPEYIILMYKADDSNNYYNFIVYKGNASGTGPIISSDIQLQADTGTDQSIGINISNYPSGTGGTLSQDIVKNIRNYYTPSQGFYVKKINEVYLIGDAEELEPKFETLNCYWILNTQDDNGNCVLFSADDIDTALADPTNPTTTYTLKSGEYFFYTTSRFDEMVILGSGTKIQMTPKEGYNDKWSVPYISEEQVNYDGIFAIDRDNWVSVSNLMTSNLTTTETQIISLAEGDTISMTGTSTISVKNSESVIDPMIVTSSYHSGKPTTEVRLTIPDGESLGVDCYTVQNIEKTTGMEFTFSGDGEKTKYYFVTGDTSQSDAGNKQYCSVSLSSVTVDDSTATYSTGFETVDGKYCEYIEFNEVPQTGTGNIKITGNFNTILNLNLYCGDLNYGSAPYIVVPSPAQSDTSSFDPINRSISFSVIYEQTISDDSGKDIYIKVNGGNLSGDGTYKQFSVGYLSIEKFSSTSSTYITSLTYQFFGDDTVNTLDISGNVIKWSISSILMANLSPDTPQVLVAQNVSGNGESGYSLIAGKDSGSIDYFKLYFDGSVGNQYISPALNGSGEETKLSVLGSFVLSSDRRENIDTARKTLSGKDFLSIYPYEVITTSDATYDDVTDSYTVNGSGPIPAATPVTLTLATSLPPITGARYLIPYSVSISGSGTITVSATYDGNNLNPIQVGSSYKNFSVSSDSFSGNSLVITLTSTNVGANTNWSVTIGSVYCYKKYTGTGFDTDDWDSVLTKIATLDSGKIFDFTYQVDPDVLIENPLVSKSFLDPNHIYNQYTICQSDFEHLTTKILNRNRS